MERVSLPAKLQSLTFAGEFQQSLLAIGFPQLQSLTLGHNFNERIEGAIFPSFQSLTFGFDFDQSLEKVKFPESLLSLTFGHLLQSLSFGDTFDQRRRDLTQRPTKPDAFGDRFNQKLGRLHPKLELLRLGDDFKQPVESWPKSLRSLPSGTSFRHSAPLPQLLSLSCTPSSGLLFPASLQHLELMGRELVGPGLRTLRLVSIRL